MSFLNPVNEPVKRFKSTDAGAPQINYNARVAGDVKTVLKACLVTGYGAKASAGWSVVNEVDHVAEFLSPSAAMSDYRLGIDDTSASSTTWYYRYQDVRVNQKNNLATKSFLYVDNAHADNGWQLFVTGLGFLLVEIIHHTATAKKTARMTYFGQVKSALNTSSGNNIMFFNAGYNGAIKTESQFYNDNSPYISLAEYSSLALLSALPVTKNPLAYAMDVAVADLVSEIYIASINGNLLLAQLPPVLGNIVNKTADAGVLKDVFLGERTAFSIFCGGASSSPSTFYTYGRSFLIRTDYWEY